MFTTSDINMTRVMSEIEALSKIGAQPSGGMTRYSFSEEHTRAAHQVADWTTAAGLEVYFDRWGNLYGRTPGFDGAKCVLTGSHVDSVPNGGNYDGPLGVLSSLEATRLILEKGIELKKPIEVVSFVEEEGARFSGLLGSRLGTGKLDDAAVAALQDRQGNKFMDILRRVNFRHPVNETIDLKDRVASYLELHIEQGHRLEDVGIPIGVVTAIASPNFMQVRLTGRSDHAGATAYEDRRDTLLAVAQVILDVRETGTSQFAGKGHMTVGHVTPKPNVANVVAGQTNITIDFRAANDQIATQMRDAVKAILSKVCSKHHIEYEITNDQCVPAAMTPQYICDAVAKGADEAGVAHQDIVSWAAHDAMVMADVTDSGMIFVPCKNGRSHTPEEYTKPEDIAAGIATLANALVQLAQ